MAKTKENEQESYASIVNGNTILLSFNEWLKYIEGLTKGIGAAKSVDPSLVLDCIGEVMEYMRTLKINIFILFQHCEQIMAKNELLEKENDELRQMLKEKIIKKEETDG